MTRKIDSDTVFRALKPEPLGRLAEDGYARNRDSDLARITAISQERPAIRRRPSVAFRPLVGAALAACVAAGAVIAVSVGDDTPGRREVAAPPVTSVRFTSARSFLLASAQIAEKAPAKTGAFWYTRERKIEWTSTYLVEPKTTGPGTMVRTRSGKLIKKPGEQKEIHLSSPGSMASTEEMWIGRGNRARTIIGIDAKVVLSPADQATWKRLGSPSLNVGIPMKPEVNDYTTATHYAIGNKQLTMADLAALPTSTGGLEAVLRRRYEADVNDPRNKAELQSIHAQPASFGEWVWFTARDLLAGPITPGTRAALYRVLAKQPNVKTVGKVTDSLGRPGIGLTLLGSQPKGFVPGVGPAKPQTRLVIDPRTAQLLDDETYALNSDGRPAARPAESTAYQAMGWTTRINERF
jgi:hypothetical protein